MALLISSRRTILVDSCGVARVIHGNGQNIFPTIRSTIDGWQLDGMEDDEFINMMFAESDEFEPRSATIQGLVNTTRKERENNGGNTIGEELERLANLERYVARGYAFENPADSDKFDDFDTQIGCEEMYRYNDNGDEV